MSFTSPAKIIVCLAVLAMTPLATAHGAIVKAVGDAGGVGSALGIDPATPRDGTRRRPFQQDSTRFRGRTADTFGETVGAGPNQLESGTQAILDQNGGQLPQVSAGGEIRMTLHQVNSDGGGPYTCMINADGTGQDWEAIDVTLSPPGRNSRNPSGAATDFPLNAAIPADQNCTGTVAGQDNVCLVRCQNQARAGPFGGVVPVQLADGGSNSTATTSSATTSSAAETASTAGSVRTASPSTGSGGQAQATSQNVTTNTAVTSDKNNNGEEEDEEE
ncbi:hypothetical protein VTK73DRAFT_1929 [Phialemonium thermophilum]|uniref:Uncharacterized protein n=1 Tax=Phialemonium thermophilum TaxID=223376 RepID=A0ABR3X7T0_9PEZI